MQNFSYLVGKALSQVKQNDLLMQLQILDNQNVRRNLPICNGFFNIDWKLLFSVNFIEFPTYFHI
jgi:hypothetical protein